MANKTKSKKQESQGKRPGKTKGDERNFFYLDDDAKHYDFSDFVRVSSYPRGMILYFGKFQPEEQKFSIYSSIMLPFDVANNLSSVIQDQLKQLEDDGLIVIDTREEK